MDKGHIYKAVVLGQLLAFLIALTASSSTELARAHASCPTLQSLLVYLLLAAIYGTVRFCNPRQKKQLTSLSHSWWVYMVLAALDVEANFLTVTAFRYTSVTSVTLLDSWSIPVALALTRLVGLAQYRSGHYGGAALCVLGLIALVATDNRGGGASAGPTAVLGGDTLVVLGATLYACGNVLQEHLLVDAPPEELLCMLGIFGALFSAAQGLPLELAVARAAPWTAAVIASWAGYVVAMLMFYSLVPIELGWGGAAILNISLLSSDVYSALARWLFFGGFTLWSGLSFGAAFANVAGGIVLYSLSGDVKPQHEAVPSDVRNVAYEEMGMLREDSSPRSLGDTEVGMASLHHNCKDVTNSTERL